MTGLIIAPAESSRGWGTKAMAVLIHYAFEDLNLHRLYTRLYASNRAAQRVAAKAGLKPEGAARQAVFHNWRYEDVIYMSILREEWRDGTAPVK